MQPTNSTDNSPPARHVSIQELSGAPKSSKHKSAKLAGRPVKSDPNLRLSLKISGLPTPISPPLSNRSDRISKTPTPRVEEVANRFDALVIDTDTIKAKARSVPSPHETSSETISQAAESRRSSWGPSSPRRPGFVSPRDLCKSLLSARKKSSTTDVSSLKDAPSYEKDIQKLLLNLEGKCEDGDLIPELFTEMKALVEAIPKGEDAFVLPLQIPACDLWRTCSKLVIHVLTHTQLDTILSKHPDADNENVPEDIPDLNKRFLLLLSHFQKNRINQIPIPETVTWQRIEDVARWIKEMHIINDETLARFIRSCSQARYSDAIARKLLLLNYGLSASSPILAKLQGKLLTMTRTFHASGANTESIEMPVELYERATNKRIGLVRWLLQFTYDSNCYLTRMQSNCFFVGS